MLSTCQDRLLGFSPSPECSNFGEEFWAEIGASATLQACQAGDRNRGVGPPKGLAGRTGIYLFTNCLHHTPLMGQSGDKE